MFVVTYRTSTNPTIITNVVSGSELCNMWCDYSFDIIDVDSFWCACAPERAAQANVIITRVG